MTTVKSTTTHCRASRNVAALLLAAYLLPIVDSARAATPLGGNLDDNHWSLVYYANDGGLLFEAGGRIVSTLEIVSEAGNFTGPTPDIIRPPFDVFSPTKLFLLRTDGFGPQFDFGPILRPGLTAQELSRDLTVNGSCLPDCSSRTDLIYVPEPHSNMWLVWVTAFATLLSRKSLRT